MNKTNKIAILGIVALFAVLTVSTASAQPSEYYLVPDDSNATYCNEAEVEIWINATETIRGGKLSIAFDPLCGNITSSWRNVMMFPDGTMGTNVIRYDFTPPALIMTFVGLSPEEQPPDNYYIGNFKVHCNSTTYCITDLNFVDETYAENNTGMISTVTDNGTFECGTPAETYTISGTTIPAANTVNITNLNTNVEYAADVDGNNYTLTLDVPGEVEAGNKLLIVACEDLGAYESNCNVTTHTVVTAPGEENVDLTLNHYCKNYYPTFPFHTWNESNWSGPAVMEMLIDNYRDPPNVPNQTELNGTGIGYNQDPCNADLEFVDPEGMMDALNKYLHAYNELPYVANYGVGNYSTIEDVLHYMCKWHYAGPGAAPAYGNYSNWMVVRGIHTNTTPSFTQGSYEIYGFWINDPKDPGGIGENTYKTVDQWSSTYHLNLTDVRECDSYKDEYVAVCEPPEDDDVEVTLAKPKPRLADPIEPIRMDKPLMVYGIEQLALEKMIKEDESLKIVKAAIDGVNEELVLYDAEFAEVFAKTVAGEPMLVSSDNGDYYIVPFNVPVDVKHIKKMPVEIERAKASGLKKFERVMCVDDKVRVKPIPVEPVKVEKTLVVVLVDAEDGSFKEASWVADPVMYLPVSKVEALKLALGEIHITAKEDLKSLKSKPTIELVYRDASPYYPDWKITVDGKVFFVGQDGMVS